MKKVNVNGKIYDFDVMVDFMDDDIREALHSELAPCTEQEFIDAYLEKDIDFIDNHANGLYSEDAE